MCYKDILICLIGNKIDLEEKREVSYEEGKNFAEENNLLFFETSAKDGNNIQEIFLESATLLVDKIENREIKLEESDNGIKINNSYEDEDMVKLKNKKRCCY
jgi:GTPase SAR1 family protein